MRRHRIARKRVDQEQIEILRRFSLQGDARITGDDLDLRQRAAQETEPAPGEVDHVWIDLVEAYALSGAAVRRERACAEANHADRARALLVTTAQSAGLWALGRISHLLLLARARFEVLEPRISKQVPPRVQRFGKRLWHRITDRFPLLADLLNEPTHAATNGFGTHTPAPSAAPVTQTAAAPAEPLDALIDALRDPSAELAAVAAIKLGARREPEAKLALHEVLKNVEGYFSPLTRVAALQAFMQALTAAPDANELEPLLELVRDIDAEVSMAAIDAVAQRAPSQLAIDRLLPVVLDDSGFFLPIVRAAATRALERAGLLSTAST